MSLTDLASGITAFDAVHFVTFQRFEEFKTWRQKFSFETSVPISLNTKHHTVEDSDLSASPIIKAVTDKVSGPGSSVGIATTGWTVRDRIPVGTRFSARPDRPWGPPSFL